jgi:hypothetical protein
MNWFLAGTKKMLRKIHSQLRLQTLLTELKVDLLA